jgi:hypothetical protein
MKTFAERIAESKTPFKDYIEELNERKRYDSMLFF